MPSTKVNPHRPTTQPNRTKPRRDSSSDASPRVAPSYQVANPMADQVSTPMAGRPGGLSRLPTLEDENDQRRVQPDSDGEAEQTKPAASTPALLPRVEEESPGKRSISELSTSILSSDRDKRRARRDHLHLLIKRASGTEESSGPTSGSSSLGGGGAGGVAAAGGGGDGEYRAARGAGACSAARSLLTVVNLPCYNILPYHSERCHLVVTGSVLNNPTGHFL